MPSLLIIVLGVLETKSLVCIKDYHITKILSREGGVIFTLTVYANVYLNAPLSVLSIIIKNKCYFKPIHSVKSFIRQIPVEGHFTKYLPSTSQNCESHQKQGQPGKPLWPRGVSGDTMTKCDVVSWMESQSRKRPLGKTKEI